MGSISSINPGLADLFQTLSSVNSPLLSSPADISALENASPTDIVQLSTAATELQGVDTLFGSSDGSSNSSLTDPSGLIANLDATLLGSQAPDSGTTSTLPSTTNPALADLFQILSSVGSSATNDMSGIFSSLNASLLGTPSTASTTDQLAIYQSGLQLAETDGLFGAGSSSFNVLG
jgi:hypothetical protein